MAGPKKKDIRKAINRDDVDALREFLSQGMKVNPSRSDEESLLLYAAKKGAVRAAEFLAENGADPNLWKENESPLLEAAERGNADIVKLLLDKGADIEGFDEDRVTPLLAAAYGGSVECLQVLIEAGADLMARSSGSGLDAIEYAAYEGNVEAFEYLSPNYRDDVVAAQQDTLKAAVIRKETEKKFSERTFTDFFIAARIDDTQTTMKLLTKGVPVDYASSSGGQAIHGAVEEGAIGVLQILVDAGADVNARTANSMGLTPLMRAVQGPECSSESVAFLLEKGADVRLKVFSRPDSDADGGWTALHYAATEATDPHVKSVAMLLDAGAEIDAEDDSGITPILLAKRWEDRLFYKKWTDNGPMFNLLRDRGADLSRVDGVAIVNAAAAGDSDRVRELICEGVDLDEFSPFGEVAISEAAKIGNLACIQALVEAGANMDSRKTPDDGTPLMKAVSVPSFECVKYLVEAGADIEAWKHRNGWTAHTHALSQRNSKPREERQQIFEYLESIGAPKKKRI